MNDAHAPSFSDSSVFVGIDVSKKKLDICLLAGKAKQLCSFDNTIGGVAALIDRLRSRPVRLIVLEATGRYERRCGVELMSHGFEVAIVNPRQPRDYARCQNLLAKTDSIDAFILASFAQVIGPRPSSLPSANQLLLDEMVARRRQVVQMHAQEGNRLQQAFEKAIQTSIKRIMRLLDQQREDLDRQIASLVDRDDDWRGKLELLKTVPGVGDVTASTLVAELPELGHAQSPADRQAGGPRADEPGLRQTSGRAPHHRRTIDRPMRALHGHAYGADVQSADQSNGRPPHPSRQTVQSGDDGLHAQTVDDPQHDGQNRRDMETPMPRNPNQLNHKSDLKINTAAAVRGYPAPPMVVPSSESLYHSMNGGGALR